MIDAFAKDYLHSDLRDVRPTMVWKLEGLSEYDVRRPLTATPTSCASSWTELSAPKQGNTLLQAFDSAFWEDHRAKIEQAAQAADPTDA